MTCRRASAQRSLLGSCCRQRNSGNCLQPAGRRIDPAQGCHGLVSERVSLVGYSKTHSRLGKCGVKTQRHMDKLSGALSVSGRLNFSRSGTQGRSIGNSTLCTHVKTDYNAMLYATCAASTGALSMMTLSSIIPVMCNNFTCLCSFDLCHLYLKLLSACLEILQYPVFDL